MLWRAELPTGFDPRDCVFAGNPQTEGAARKVLAVAKRTGDGQDDVAREIVWHIRTSPIAKGDAAFVDAQLNRLAELWRALDTPRAP
ncbi:hypothetical protein sos41_32260 [Alphaproteobacteria bacterium SO-S41]|nr:hypothetical protein sos41_32260 [Alphaproteobacteria bacterium SO-S41]